DVDLADRLLRVRNKPGLDWQVKTRAERDVPLVPVLAEVLAVHLSGRTRGPGFRRRRWAEARASGVSTGNLPALEKEVDRRVSSQEAMRGRTLSRVERGQLARGLWRDLGAVKEDRVRVEFMRLTRAIGPPGCTAPKALRHLFATGLQEGRVD